MTRLEHFFGHEKFLPQNFFRPKKIFARNFTSSNLLTVFRTQVLGYSTMAEGTA